MNTRCARRRGPGGLVRHGIQLALGTALALAQACSSSEPSVTSGEPAAVQDQAAPQGEHQATPAPADAAAVVGQVAPAFSLATLSGASFAFPSGKPTAIWFTANGCRPCIPKAQALDRIKAEFGERLAVLGVDINPAETEAVFKDWLKETGDPRFEAALDQGGKLAVAWGVTDTSTVVITDATGKVVYRSSGGADEATFREALGKAGLS